MYRISTLIVRVLIALCHSFFYNVKYMNQIILLGIKINPLTLSEILNTASVWVRKEGSNQHHIVSINPEGVLLAQRDTAYRDVANNASLVLTDGVGVQYACMLSGIPIPHRMPGVELMISLCRMAAENSWKVYLVGGAGETAKMTAEKLRLQFPGLIIEGEEGIPIVSQRSKVKSQKFEGPSGQLRKPLDNQELIKRINAFQPQLLFVAFGQPKQELWIDEHVTTMPSVKVAMGVGGAFDFLAGKVMRAPLPLRALGLEWLWRLVIQPWRLPRIINATVKFLWLVVKKRFTR